VAVTDGGSKGGAQGADEPAELSLEQAAMRLGVPVPTLYKRIRAGTLPARQEPGGRRRWMVRISDLPEPTGERAPAVDTDLVVELLRRADTLEAARREAEARSVRLETENTALRARVRDLQHVLRSLNAAMSDSIQALTAPDSPND
jgi:excisionase family DNA binding protein